MMRRYVTVDVFTERQFGGNPLAVVLDAQGLTPQQMQAIAAEFNYAETTFVLPPADPRHTAQVRIFTPRSEVPFAGHPNVGTAYVLATRDPALATSGRLLFEEGAGLVPVSVLMEQGKVIGAEVTAPAALTRHATVTVDQVADCLSLSAGDISTAEPRVLSVGLPFLVAELATREALGRARPNLAAHEALLPLDGADAIYFYTCDVDRARPVRSHGTDVCAARWHSGRSRDGQCDSGGGGIARGGMRNRRRRDPPACSAGRRHGAAQRAAHTRAGSAMARSRPFTWAVDVFRSWKACSRLREQAG